MDIAHTVLEYLKALVWPIVVLFLAIRFRKVIYGFVPGAKIKFSISGVTIETTLADLERSVSESLRGKALSVDQWAWLRKLRNSGRTKYDHVDYEQLRPLRNSGMIREHPEGWLSNAEEIEITHLGRLLLEAYERRGE